MCVHVNNVKPTDQAAGEVRYVWRDLTISTHGGSQSVHNFKERNGAPVGAYTPTQQHERAELKNEKRTVHSLTRIWASC